ncbi:hypothetical protein EJ06DRAFT_509525 [Trichodelitschia bisporula]|uniref:Pectate lyase n=1 Tax=Trichodelitschia bisporula TaxID=703511 RepID=A0A6G1HXW1_9PEZI|nr:hypothetical protein EJ06DRAFT_509525 [Trichodelitschia bisporula]
MGIITPIWFLAWLALSPSAQAAVINVGTQFDNFSEDFNLAPSRVIRNVDATRALLAENGTTLHIVFPKPAGNVNLSAVKHIAAGGHFDGGMKLYDRSPSTCKQQKEGGDKDAIFLLENGATLSNILIGPNNGEGVHCLGTCTLRNVWWMDVCEDAATFKQKSGVSTVTGGGARKASDKVFQHNGGGTLKIHNFYAQDIGKLYRSCGNCKQQSKRSVDIENVVVHKGKVGVGINGNLGDHAMIKNSCFKGSDICWLFKGVTSGEPSRTAKAPDGKVCQTQAMKESC